MNLLVKEAVYDPTETGEHFYDAKGRYMAPLESKKVHNHAIQISNGLIPR